MLQPKLANYVTLYLMIDGRGKLEELLMHCEHSITPNPATSEQKEVVPISDVKCINMVSIHINTCRYRYLSNYRYYHDNTWTPVCTSQKMSNQHDNGNSPLYG